MSASVGMIHLDVNSLWNWYWAGKAHVVAPGTAGLDQLVSFWNLLMDNDVMRIAALAVVALWFMLALVDSFLTQVSTPAAALALRQREGAQEQPLALTSIELKAELARLNRTQSELAAELRVTRAYVSQLVNGRKPFRSELQQRCRKILDEWGC